jgi:DNA-binding PadR family transcriptional regulator
MIMFELLSAISRHSLENLDFGTTQFKEQQHLVFLWSISEASDGVTGYELQQLYKLPLSNVYRFLKELQNEGHVEITEKIVEGRAQKRYHINQKGLDRLRTLQMSAANRISFLYEIISLAHTPHIESDDSERHLSDMTSLHNELFQPSFFDMTVLGKLLQSIRTKEDALYYLNHFKELIIERKEVHNKRSKAIQNHLLAVEEMIDEVQKIETFQEGLMKEIVHSKLGLLSNLHPDQSDSDHQRRSIDE